ncbi:MAG: response regulator transcription factor [Anaerolineae bacterium]
MEPNAESIRVLIADDHAVVRKGLQMFLAAEPRIELVGEAADGRDAIAKARKLTPDVVLMDLMMPQVDGVEATYEIKRHCPRTEVIILTSFSEEENVVAALQAGAIGYLLKDAQEDVLVEAIKAAYRGEPHFSQPALHQLMKRLGAPDQASPVDGLTERELDVLRLVAHGLSNKEIARSLGLSKGTVKVHVSNVLNKLGASSRTQAAMMALQIGLITLSHD